MLLSKYFCLKWIWFKSYVRTNGISGTSACRVLRPLSLFSTRSHHAYLKRDRQCADFVRLLVVWHPVWNGSQRRPNCLNDRRSRPLDWLVGFSGAAEHLVGCQFQRVLGPISHTTAVEIIHYKLLGNFTKKILLESFEHINQRLSLSWVMKENPHYDSILIFVLLSFHS